MTNQVEKTLLANLSNVQGDPSTMAQQLPSAIYRSCARQLGGFPIPYASELRDAGLSCAAAQEQFERQVLPCLDELADSIKMRQEEIKTLQEENKMLKFLLALVAILVAWSLLRF
eukprot:SAG11_NODE_1950_length_4013_cov_4.004854_1_plen_115_part_00